MENRGAEEGSGKERNDAESELLVQLHIAEYNMLMARLTNWITLQNSLWAVLVIFLALIAQVYNSLPSPRLLAWGSVLVAEYVCIFWYVMQLEVYRSIAYVEKELRPKIAPLVQNQRFWNWEAHVAEGRGTRFIWWEWMSAFLALLAVAGVALCRTRSWTRSDYLGLALASIVYISLLTLAIGMYRMRRRIFS